MKELSVFYPLSFQQKGILAEIQIEQDSSLFHIAKILELRSSVEISRIRKAFFQIMSRHDVLSMQFNKEEASLGIREPSERAFTSIYIPDEHLLPFLDKRVKQPFDLSNDPLFTLTHIRTDSGRSFIFILAHHLITDLWSIGIFLDELFSLLNGEQLSPKPKSYLEFIGDQDSELKADRGKNALKYWQEAFQQFPTEPQAIPPDIFSEKNGEDALIEPFELSSDVSSSLLHLARRERLQVVSLLLTIYSYLFFLRTGKIQFCIGTTSNGRQNLSWARTIGLFSNPVPLMISINPSASFAKVARMIQRQLFTHLKHHQLPLSYLIESLRKEGIFENSPPFKHLFVYQQVPSVTGELKKLSLPGGEVEVVWKNHQLGAIDWNHPFSPYDLTFYMHEMNGNLMGFVEHLPGRYSIEFVGNLIQEFQQLCGFFADDPKKKITDFKPLPSTFGKPKQKGESILEKLKLYSRSNRDMVALFQGAKAITYGQFEKWTNRIARMLISRGIKPGDCLCVHMNHSLETLLLLVSTWKCGAAFVPIDITTSHESAQKIQIESGSKWLIKELEIRDAALYSEKELPILTDPLFPAYLIFTSGSTGKPKGVVVTHENLSSYLSAIKEAYPFNPPVHFAVHSSLSFDLTITSLFYPLYSGQSAHLFDRKSELTDLFSEILSHPLLTHLKCTPSHLKCFQWIDAPKSRIQTLILGGEPLTKSTILSIENKFHSTPVIINEYGPSEGTVGCIFHLFTYLEPDVCVPIGMPLENSDAELLGPFLHPLSSDVEGNLYLMGHGVSLGYWNDPKRTAQAFLPDLFTRGKRMYDSGDIAKRNSKGQLEFLGRRDTQVKVRGHRIEVEEVQQKLLECIDVKDAYICVETDPKSHEQILIAYILLEDEKELDSNLDKLREAMPSYMIPSHFIRLENIPLTPNGKVDEKKLKSYREKSTKTFEQKTINAIERKILEVWSFVLGIDKGTIKITESFFSIGGDSIKAIQVVALAKKEGILLSVKDILEKQTIHAIAATSKISQVQPVEEVKWVPLTPIQKWFFANFQGNFNHYNQAVILKGFSDFSPALFRSTICRIAASQPLMRSTFSDPNRAKIGTIEEFEKNLLMIEKSLLLSEFKEELAKLQSCFDIEKGPLIGVGLFRIEGQLQVVIVMHHLITDGVSWHLLLDSLKSGLRVELDNEQPPVSLLNYCSAFTSVVEFTKKRSKFYPVSRQKKLHISMDLDRLQIGEQHFANIEDLAFAAFTDAYFNVAKVQSQTFQFERHGRQLPENAEDFSSLIGWFTQLMSCSLAFEPTWGAQEKLQAARDALTKGVEFDINPEILFNYLGELPSVHGANFTCEPITEGVIDSNSYIPYSLQSNLLVQEGSLVMEILFDEQLYSESFQEEFLSSFARAFDLFSKELLKCGRMPPVPQDFGSSLPLPQFKVLMNQWSIHPNQVDRILPLLPSEKGIYLHSLTHPGTKEYLQQLILNFDGNLNEQDLLSAFSDCIEKFPSMRTTFHLKDLDEPQKIIFRKGVCQIDKESDLESYLERDQKQPFCFETLPLIRLAYVKKSRTETQIILSFHHLIMDGWSLAIFFDELLSRMASNSFEKYELPPVEYKSAHTREEALDYWKGLLSLIDRLTHIPKLKAVSERDSIQEKKEVRFDSFTTEYLMEACRQKGVTIAHLLHSSWAYLLSLFLNEQAVLFGSVVSGRSQRALELENQVGQLSSVIPVFARVAPNMTLLDLAKQVQDQIQESEQYLSISTGEIEALSLFGRDLIDHIVVIENYPFSGQANQLIQRHRLPFKLVSAELKEQSQYPFTLSFFPNENLSIECQFDPNRVKSNWVESILNTYKILFNPISDALNRPIREVSVVSDKIEHQTLKKNQIHSIPEQFKDQWNCKKTRIAVVDGDRQLTYQTLDLLSDRIALNLIALGIEADENIGIALDRSLEWIIVWLGILKAGSAYTPLRLEDPLERKKAILEGAKIRFLIADEEADFFDTEVVVLKYNDLVSREIKHPICLPSVDPEQLAYTLFTSGTTGVPKGIAMPHGSVINHLNWIIEDFQLRESDRMLQLTAYSFDVSICELYALLVGGTLVLAPKAADKDLALLQSTVEKNKVTFVQMVPSMLEALLVPETKDSFRSVRQVLCGADVLHPHQLEKWLKDFDIPIANLYGLTETCIDSTYFDCAHFDLRHENIPIGQAIQNVWVYNFDECLNFLPTYAKGTLYIGGGGLARCYAERPDLTAERFLPDPCSFGKRMFSSCDQVTLDSEGNFHFAGRIDNQVKIRGVRIELDEIRSVISRLKGVEEVYIKVTGQTPRQSICCYFTAHRSVYEIELKSYALQFLPSFMVPNFFIQLDEFPLTPHGKINSKVLPEPKMIKQSIEKITKKEFDVAKWFSDVLQINIDDIDPEANFFDLGGNSLSLMKLHYKVEQGGYSLPVATLFEYPSIRQLSHFLSTNCEKKVDLVDADLRAKKRRLKIQEEKGKKFK